MRPLVWIGACFVVALLRAASPAADEEPKPPEPRLLLAPPKGPDGEVKFADLAISPDGKTAAVEMGLCVGFVDLSRRTLMRSTNDASRTALEITGMAFAGDGEWLVARHERDFVRAWSSSTAATKLKLAPTWKPGDPDSCEGARVFAASPRRREAALGMWDRAVEFVDLSRPSSRQRVEFESAFMPAAIAFSPDGNRVAVVLKSADDATRVNVYARNEGKPAWTQVASFLDEAPEGADVTAQRPVNVWKYVAAASDGSVVVAAGSFVDGRSKLQQPAAVRGWDAKTGKRLWSVACGEYHTSLLWSPREDAVFVGTSRTAEFVDPRTGASIRKLAPHRDGCDAYAMDATGDRLYAVTNHLSSASIVVWDVPLIVTKPR